MKYEYVQCWSTLNAGRFTRVGPCVRTPQVLRDGPRAGGALSPVGLQQQLLWRVRRARRALRDVPLVAALLAREAALAMGVCAPVGTSYIARVRVVSVRAAGLSRTLHAL